jgi:hypothetical protein
MLMMSPTAQGSEVSNTRSAFASSRASCSSIRYARLTRFLAHDGPGCASRSHWLRWLRLTANHTPRNACQGQRCLLTSDRKAGSSHGNGSCCRHGRCCCSEFVCGSRRASLADQANRNVEGHERRDDPEESDVAGKGSEPEEGASNHKLHSSAPRPDGRRKTAAPRGDGGCARDINRGRGAQKRCRRFRAAWLGCGCQHRRDEGGCVGGDGDMDRFWFAYPGDQVLRLESLEFVLEGGRLCR